MDELLRDYLDLHLDASPLIALALMGIGLVFLTQGWKFYRQLITLSAGYLGLLVGSRYAERMTEPHLDLVFILGFGAVFAALAWPAIKWAVCLFGGVIGGLAGFALWRYTSLAFDAPDLAELAWVGGLMGVIIMGLLAFVIFQVVVVVVTSFQGGMLLISGLLALSFALDGPDRSLFRRLDRDVALVPLMVFIPTIIGAIFQENKHLLLQAKKRKAAAKA
ncbi:MAG: hypothetical protein ACOC95_07680 [Planctomycetota bacterium]